VFSKAVTGVTAGSFTLTATGSASGVIGAISEAGTGTSIYGVTVGSLAGPGTLRLDVKASGSGIIDAAGTALTSGFITGETYTIVPAGSQPVISSSPTASGTYGTPFLYTITASGSPASYTATGLPPTLTLNPSTATATFKPHANLHRRQRPSHRERQHAYAHRRLGHGRAKRLPSRQRGLRGGPRRLPLLRG